MTSSEEFQETLGLFRQFFERQFPKEAQGESPEVKLKELMENPLLKRYFFSDGMASIIDHSQFRYRYLTAQAEQITGITVDDLMRDGPNRVLELMDQTEARELLTYFEHAALVIRDFPREDQIHLYVSYTFHMTVNGKRKHLYQHLIPLTIDESGMPAYALILLSDVTSLTIDRNVRLWITLNSPGKPVQKVFETSRVLSPLSDREQEIVRLLAEGLNSGEIGNRLNISEDTVRTHRRNIMEKIKARNAVHMVMMAVTNGWI